MLGFYDIFGHSFAILCLYGVEVFVGVKVAWEDAQNLVVLTCSLALVLHNRYETFIGGLVFTFIFVNKRALLPPKTVWVSVFCTQFLMHILLLP